MGRTLLLWSREGGPISTPNGRATRTEAPARPGIRPLCQGGPAWGIWEPTSHELRHTAASLAIAAGADVKAVRAMLGHKTATMTLDRYGYLFPEHLDEVADAMDAARRQVLVV